MLHSRTGQPLSFLLLLTAGVLACGGDNLGPSGSLEISTTTSGPQPDLDPDGYTFAVDGGTSQPIGVNATVTLDNVAAGAHTIQLSGLAGNCAVEANPREVTVTSGGTAEVSFDATCAALPPIAITVLDLGALRSSDGSVATDINDDGKIVGYAFTPAGTRAFLYQDGATTDLGRLPGMEHAQAEAINASGTVVGVSYPNGGSERPFVWTSGTGMQPLQSVSESCLCTYPTDINAHGTIVGRYRPGGVMHAVVWLGGIPQDIHPGSTGSSIAFAVNDNDRVVGTHWAANDGRHGRPFSWTTTDGFEFLAPFGTELGEALDMSADGGVVGWGGAIVEQFKAYLLRGTETTPLGTLGGPSSVATAINAQGQVVGRAEKSRNSATAFLWTSADGMRDLGLPAGTNFGQAWAINNNGSAVGWTSGSTVAEQATLWQLSVP